MKNSAKKQGFSIISILIIVVVVVLAGFIGYLFYDNYIVGSQIKDQSPTASGIPVAPEVVDTADLDNAGSVLDSINLDADIDTDLDQLEAELDSF
jgi:hypothetical protein